MKSAFVGLIMVFGLGVLIYGTIMIDPSQMTSADFLLIGFTLFLLGTTLDSYGKNSKEQATVFKPELRE